MSEMIEYPLYFRRYGVLTQGQVMKPRVFPIARLALPKQSIYHYLSEDGTGFGPAGDDQLIRNAPRQVFIDHITELREPQGSPRPTQLKPSMMINEYRRKNHRLRPLIKLDSALKEPSNLIVENYALLPHMSRYVRSWLSEYQAWANVQRTLYLTINRLCELTTRHHFIELTLPDRMPVLEDLRKAEVRLTRDNLQHFRTPSQFALLDLWTWAGMHRSSSQLAQLDPAFYDRVNFVVRRLNGWCVINLGRLNSWRADKDRGITGAAPTTFALRLLKMLDVVFETTSPVLTPDKPELEEPTPTEETPGTDPTVGEDPTPAEVDAEKERVERFDDAAAIAELEKEFQEAALPAEPAAMDDVEVTDEDGNIIEQDQALLPDVVGGMGVGTRTLESAILNKADILADQGAITAAEFRRLQRLAEAYKGLRNPYNRDELLIDTVDFAVEDIALQNTEIVKHDEVIADQSMRFSTVDQMERQHISKVLQRDILRSVLSLQHAGVAITGYTINPVRDIMNENEEHVIRLAPAVGQPTTVRFTVPTIRPDGTYLYNGVTYRQRKQRGDLPIRKVSAVRVALTSYYAKAFVEKSDRSRFNYDSWMVKTLLAKCLDPKDPIVSDPRVSQVDDDRNPVPLAYSVISTKLAGFTCRGIRFAFDYAQRHKDLQLSEADFNLESNGAVICGKTDGTVALMDKDSSIFLVHANGKQEVWGGPEDAFELPSERAPAPMVEFKLYGKAIPVGVVLAYLVGFDKLIERLRLKVRRVPNGERLNLGEDEFVVRFKDESLVFARDEGVGTLLFSGFNLYHAQIKNYSVNAFNRREVYISVLERAGLGLRYLRELDMMNALFVDPITRELLEWMKEPTEFIDLLIRSTQLLVNRHVPSRLMIDGIPHSMERVRGYERIAGAVYGRLSASIRQYNSRASSGIASIQIHPGEIMGKITQDPATAPVEQTNPIHNLREREVITFGGNGGRGRRSMVAAARLYTHEDMGFVSEATVDSGDVAIITYLSPNANITSVRGTVRLYDETRDGTSTLLSTAAQLSPAADRDDPKRICKKVPLGSNA